MATAGRPVYTRQRVATGVYTGRCVATGVYTRQRVATGVYTGRCVATGVYTGRCVATGVYTGRCVATGVYTRQRVATGVYTGRCVATGVIIECYIMCPCLVACTHSGSYSVQEGHSEPEGGVEAIVDSVDSPMEGHVHCGRSGWE